MKARKIFQFAFAVLAVIGNRMAALTAPGMCAIIHIPADYPTVQQGLNAAAEQDTVLVSEGLYSENLTFPPINLTLASQFLMDGDSLHISGTILDGSTPANQDSGSVVYMEGDQDSTTLIVGLTLQGGAGTVNGTWVWGNPHRYGGGCVIRHASPTLISNRIRSNSAARGGGVYLGTGANALMQGNEIFNNMAAGESDVGYGGGIMGDSCSPVIMGNNIHHNTATYNGGGFQFLRDGGYGGVLISNNYFHHNQAFWSGIGDGGYGDYTVSGNIITDNFSHSTGLGFGGIPTNVTLVNNQFLRNTALEGASAINLTSGSNCLMSNNLFQENSDMLEVVNFFEGTYSVMNNQFVNNTSTAVGIIYIGPYALLDMHHNLISGNTGAPGFVGSAIRSYAITAPVIHDNNIYGNSSIAVAVSPAYPTRTINAVSNWWGDPSGPYHPTLNPNGLGDSVGDGVLFDPWLNDPVLSVQPEPEPAPPLGFRLYPPHPNPFNAATTITFELPTANYLTLRIYDTAGREVARLLDEWREAGKHEVSFDGSNLTSGIYFFSLNAGNWSAKKKIVLLK